MWLIPSGRATILENLTAAHVHALCWMWQRLQRLQLSQILCHKHMEHDTLTDVCTGCEDVCKTKAFIEPHACKHHAGLAFDLCLVWLMPQQQRHHLGIHNSCNCQCLVLDVATFSFTPHILATSIGNMIDSWASCAGCVDIYNAKAPIQHHVLNILQFSPLICSLRG